MNNPIDVGKTRTLNTSKKHRQMEPSNARNEDKKTSDVTNGVTEAEYTGPDIHTTHPMCESGFGLRRKPRNLPAVFGGNPIPRRNIRLF